VSAEPRILIIGAGLGGLCLAQGLRRSGVDVAVFERDQAAGARAQGYRVHLDARGMRPLRDCLPAERYELFTATLGQPSTGVTRFRVDGSALSPIGTERFPDSDTEVLARPGRAVDRLCLREILLDGLADAVHFGKEFTRYELVATGGVRAHFADGRTATGDLLVGADGVSSPVRRQLLPQVTLADTGTRWLGGKTPLDGPLRTMLPAELSDRAVSVQDRDAMFFLAAVLFENPPPEAAARLRPELQFTQDRDYLMWALVGRSGQLPVPDRDLAAMSPAQLHRVARNATADRHPLLAALVDAADPDSGFYLAIHATGAVDGWPAGPVTLLGDAVHAGPVNGNGANGALRDAGLLNDQLRAATRQQAPLMDALHRYQVQMLRNAHAVQAATRAHATRMTRVVGR
jgi:2-polyprenyl-6-methoxyphenol hydroxylase-like FAD-dependent oxidoreductase